MTEPMRTRKPTYDDLSPREWGTAAERDAAKVARIYAHTCVRTLRDAVLSMIEDPQLTRRQLRARLLYMADLIETWGPDAPYPAVPFYDLEIEHPTGYATPKHWEDIHLSRLTGESDESYQKRLAEAAPKVEAYWGAAIS